MDIAFPPGKLVLFWNHGGMAGIHFSIFIFAYLVMMILSPEIL
jgi:hypothetical protein